MKLTNLIEAYDINGQYIGTFLNAWDLKRTLGLKSKPSRIYFASKEQYANRIENIKVRIVKPYDVMLPYI